MKKLILTIAITLAITGSAAAQSGSGALDQTLNQRQSASSSHASQREVLELGALTCGLANDLARIQEHQIDRAQALQDKLCGPWTAEASARWEAMVDQWGWRTTSRKMNKVIKLAGHRQSICGPSLPSVQEVIQQCLLLPDLMGKGAK